MQSWNETNDLNIKERIDMCAKELETWGSDKRNQRR